MQELLIYLVNTNSYDAQDMAQQRTCYYIVGYIVWYCKETKAAFANLSFYQNFSPF